MVLLASAVVMGGETLFTAPSQKRSCQFWWKHFHELTYFLTVFPVKGVKIIPYQCLNLVSWIRRSMCYQFSPTCLSSYYLIAERIWFGISVNCHQLKIYFPTKTLTSTTRNLKILLAILHFQLSIKNFDGQKSILLKKLGNGNTPRALGFVDA